MQTRRKDRGLEWHLTRHFERLFRSAPAEAMQEIGEFPWPDRLMPARIMEVLERRGAVHSCPLGVNVLPRRKTGLTYRPGTVGACDCSYEQDQDAYDEESDPTQLVTFRRMSRSYRLVG